MIQPEHLFHIEKIRKTKIIPIILKPRLKV